jgi:hypothetical protein
MTAPDWLQRRVSHWCGVLGLSEWKIEVEVVKPDGKDDTACATADLHPRRNYARINIRQSYVKRGRELDRTIIHELLHVCHSRVDDIVENAMCKLLGEPAGIVAFASYRMTQEPMIDHLSYVIEELHHARPRRGTSRRAGR